MEPLPQPIIINVKRQYNKKNKIPLSTIGEQPPKPKRKYTRKIKPIVVESLKPPAVIIPEPPKPKRKYTRKIKPIVVESLKPSTIPIEPIPEPSVGEPPKQKRKYTKKIKPIVVESLKPPAVIVPEPPKQKRKYTRKIKPIVVESLKPAPHETIAYEKDIKLSPQSPIIMLQEQHKKNAPMPRLNETYIALMKDLAFVMRHNKDFMRARAYDNARETIENIREDITTPEQLRNKPGIGKTIHQKLIDFLERGTLNVLDHNRAILEKKRTMDLFINIYGIGEKKAEELVDAGIHSIAALREQQDRVLNDKQKIGLRYYEDILQRIPRAEIEEYEQIFMKHVPATMQMQIVGSYRRGLQSSGDIDVILTTNNPRDFVVFIDRLISEGVILEVLSRGPSKCLVVAKLSWAQYARRIDFLYTSPAEFPFSILYFTGSKGFNTAMREHALKLNMTLNEHGLSTMEGRKKGALVDHVFPTERSIFDYLNLEYKEPAARVDGSAVVVRGSVAPMASSPQKMAVPKPAKKIAAPKSQSETSTVVLQNIQKFKKDGIKVLESLPEKALEDMVKEANQAFHDKGEPVLTDTEYDILRDFIAKKWPQNVANLDVGAEVSKNKAKLPYEMASMDKIKPDSGALAKWTAKYQGPYVISCKLDGVSGLYTTENPGSPKLYTRGDGKVGQDVSYLIPYLRLPKQNGVVIRGEFIIKRRVFEEKYKNTFSNSRNLVAGIVNAKSLDNKIRDVDFVAYEVIRPENLVPSKQMAFLEGTKSVEVVKHQTATVLTNETLSEILQKWRDPSIPENTYEIDGIIVSDDKVYPRTSGNPEHSFAFKMVLSDQIAETHVLDVEWNVSKDGYLKPRVRVNEVELGGVKINYATGFNAAFIEKNKIGIGAIVQIIRSGDVIPKIEKVVVPAENPKMPDVPYKWNATHIDIMLEGEAAAENITIREKQIAQFFKGIEVDGLGPGNVAKIVKAGYDSICKVLAMTEADFMKIEGFQRKTSEKLANGIKSKIATASLETIMAVSNQFGRGFGKERIELIMKEYPDVLQERDLTKLLKIHGISNKTGREFIENIPKFMEFLKECQLESKLVEATTAAPQQIQIDTNHPLYGKTVVFTGFRDKDLETKLKRVGAKMGATVNSKTFAVVVKTTDEDTGKAADARRLGIPVLQVDDFIAKYV